MDDSRAVLLSFLWFEDVALLQALAVKDLGVDLGELELVHPSPLFCKQQLLWDTFTNQKTLVSTSRLHGSLLNNLWRQNEGGFWPWTGGWSHSAVQRSRRRWWGRRHAAAAGWEGRAGCRSDRCPPHGSSYSSHPGARRYDQTHPGLRNINQMNGKCEWNDGCCVKTKLDWLTGNHLPA